MRAVPVPFLEIQFSIQTFTCDSAQVTGWEIGMHHDDFTVLRLFSFVRDVLTDPNDAAIASTIVTLAQSMGLNVIAEGVETEAQRDKLANLGCHTYQGYLFGYPAPGDELLSRILSAAH